MLILPYGTVNWVFLGISSLFAIMFLAEAWVNIVNQKVSKFSIDAFILFLVQRIGTKQTKQQAGTFPRSKAEIIMLGIWALLAGLAAIREIFTWINKYGPP